MREEDRRKVERKEDGRRDRGEDTRREEKII